MFEKNRPTEAREAREASWRRCEPGGGSWEEEERLRGRQLRRAENGTYSGSNPSPMALPAFPLPQHVSVWTLLQGRDVCTTPQTFLFLPLIPAVLYLLLFFFSAFCVCMLYRMERTSLCFCLMSNYRSFQTHVK